MQRKRQAILISESSRGLLDPDNKDFRVTDSSGTHCYISNITTPECKPQPGAILVIEPTDEVVPNLHGVYDENGHQKYDPLYWKVVTDEGQ